MKMTFDQASIQQMKSARAEYGVSVVFPAKLPLFLFAFRSDDLQ